MPLFGQCVVLPPLSPPPARANGNLASRAELLNPGDTEEALRNNFKESVSRDAFLHRSLSVVKYLLESRHPSAAGAPAGESEKQIRTPP